METFSVLLAFCGGNSAVTGEFPTQRPVTRSFDVFFDMRLNKRLRKRTVEQTMETLVIWDATALIMTSLQWSRGIPAVHQYASLFVSKTSILINILGGH